jgi:hypothetical protein
MALINTEKILDYCYKHKREYIRKTSPRLFDRLIELVEAGEITSLESLVDYGFENNSKLDV